MVAKKLLYHYCSTQTGFAILQNRKFRLSALSSANDTLEGRVLGKVFGQLLRETDLPADVVDVASVIAEGYPDSTEGFAFCLSENGDLLSQWRSYGRDGSGIALGFSPDILVKDFGNVNFGSRFFELVKVSYGEEELRSTLRPHVEKIATEFLEFGAFVKLKKGITKSDALRMLADRRTEAKVFVSQSDKAPAVLDRLLKAVAPLHFQIYGTKPFSFHEECEWRIIRYRHMVALPEIEYFADDTSVRPYIDCLMADPAKEALKEIVLGPKHKSNLNWFRAFLNSVGLSHATVRCSSIESYR